MGSTVKSDGDCQIRGIEPPVNQARSTGEVRLDDEIGPYEAERLAVLAVNGPLPSNFVAARLSDTENCT